MRSLLELGIAELEQLDGLQRAGSLRIGGNDLLTELATLDRFELDGALLLWGNAALSRCDAAALATRLDTTCSCPEGSIPECTPSCSKSSRGSRTGPIR